MSTSHKESQIRNSVPDIIPEFILDDKHRGAEPIAVSVLAARVGSRI